MKHIYIWGTGKIAKEVMEECSTLNLYQIVGAIDNNKELAGETFYGIPVCTPEILLSGQADTVVVLTDALEAIEQQIRHNYSHLNLTIENKNYFYKEAMLKRYDESQDPEIQETIAYIKQNGLDVFNHSFTKGYKELKHDIAFDSKLNLYVVNHNGKKLYFPNIFKSEASVNHYYNSILLEQDEASPHRYLSDRFSVKKGDVVVDVGTAEGNFALEVIDLVSKIYLVEADDAWIYALQHTFANYSDKVEIVKGYVSSYCDGNTITLDSIIDSPVNFIKLDVEGNEWDALHGAQKLIEMSKDLKLAVCAYHGDFDQELIEGYMHRHDIESFHSSGFMWFPTMLRQTYVSTRLNRGIVFGTKG